MILDSAAAINRARAAMGKPDGAGMCLANNYAWWGSVQSIGPGAGHYARAIDGWNYATKRHPDINSAPAGVPVWFGASPTRHDANAGAGDVGLSLGNGYGIFTDSPNGTPGIMSFAARGLQIARPPLGWTEDFLGHDTQAGLQWVAERTPVVEVVIAPPPVPTIPGEDPMQMVTVAGSGPLDGDIAVYDGFDSVYHTTSATDAYRLGRSMGVLKPNQNTDGAIRARLAELGLNIDTNEHKARLSVIKKLGGKLDGFYEGKF